MNQVNLIGRLTRDPDYRMTQSGKHVAQFMLAVPKAHKNANGKSEADFISCVLWDKQADLAKQYLHKGHRLAISGRLQSRSYVVDDGSKRYVTEVIVKHIEFLEPKPAANIAEETPPTAAQPWPDDAADSYPPEEEPEFIRF